MRERFKRIIDGRACWYEADEAISWNGESINTRIVNADDNTARELFDYNPKCAFCWVHAAHSGDYHRKEISS